MEVWFCIGTMPGDHSWTRPKKGTARPGLVLKDISIYLAEKFG